MIEDSFFKMNEVAPDSFHSFIILCFLSLRDQQIRECNSGWRKVPLSTLRITLNWPENSFTAQLTKQDKRGDHCARHISFPFWKYSRLWRAPEKNEMEEKNNKCEKRQKHISPNDEIKLFDASPMSNPIYGWSARRPRWICRCPISRPNALSSTPPTLPSPPHYVKILRNDLILKFCW